MDYIKEYFDKLYEGCINIDAEKIDYIANLIYQAWKNGNQIFIIGNGGSASTASHMACDLSKGTLDNFYDENLKGQRIISLTDNVSSITAIGNDLGYEHVFSQQLKPLVKAGDLVVLISASGNSPSIIKAIEVANASGATTIGFLGFGGGKAKGMVDHSVVYEESHYGRVEDFHLILNHVIKERLIELMKEKEIVY